MKIESFDIGIKYIVVLADDIDIYKVNKDAFEDWVDLVDGRDFGGDVFPGVDGEPDMGKFGTLSWEEYYVSEYAPKIDLKTFIALNKLKPLPDEILTTSDT